MAAGVNACLQVTSPHQVSSSAKLCFYLNSLLLCRMACNTLSSPQYPIQGQQSLLSTRNVSPSASYGHIHLFKTLPINNLYSPWYVQAFFFLTFSWRDIILQWKLLVPKCITWYFLLGNIFAASPTSSSMIPFSSSELPILHDGAPR